LLQEGNKDQPGVVPRTLQRLFDEAYVDTSVSYTFSLSMLEVYKGSLRDLLVCPQPVRCTDPASKWYKIFFLPCREAQMILDLKEPFQVFWDNNEDMNTVVGKGDQYPQFC
jgi:hypothetical protein